MAGKGTFDGKIACECDYSISFLFGVWAMFVQSAAQGLNEIAIVGEGPTTYSLLLTVFIFPTKW